MRRLMMLLLVPSVLLSLAGCGCGGWGKSMMTLGIVHYCPDSHTCMYGDKHDDKNCSCPKDCGCHTGKR